MKQERLNAQAIHVHNNKMTTDSMIATNMAMRDTMGVLGIQTNAAANGTSSAYSMNTNNMASEAVVAAFAAPPSQHPPAAQYGEGSGLAKMATGGNDNNSNFNLGPGNDSLAASNKNVNIVNNVNGSGNDNGNLPAQPGSPHVKLTADGDDYSDDEIAKNINITQAKSGESLLEANDNMFQNQLNVAMEAEDAFMDEIVGHMETAGK